MKRVCTRFHVKQDFLNFPATLFFDVRVVLEAPISGRTVHTVVVNLLSQERQRYKSFTPSNNHSMQRHCFDDYHYYKIPT